MEEVPGLETGLALRLLIPILRYFRPPDYAAMSYQERLRTDFFLMISFPANGAVFVFSLVILALIAALGIEVPNAMEVTGGSLACSSSLLLAVGAMGAVMKGRISPGMAGTLMLVAVNSTAFIVSFFDPVLLVTYPWWLQPQMLLFFTNYAVAAVAAVLVSVFYFVAAYFAAIVDPLPTISYSALCLGLAPVSMMLFAMFAFNKAASDQREAMIATQTLEHATFEALMIFDERLMDGGEHSGLLTVNARFEDLTGVPAAEVRDPASLAALVHGVDFPTEVSGAGLGEARVIHGAILYRRFPAGVVRKIPVDVLIRRLKANSDRVAVAIRDVSARVEMESALRHADVSEARARGKAAFLSTISHELRNPLNAVLGMTQIVASMKLQPEVKAGVDNIVSATKAVLNILHQLLDYGKEVEGSTILPQEIFNLRDLVMETLTLAMLQVDDSKVAVFGAFDSTCDHWIVSDPGRVRQVTLNFLSNAIKFTRKGHIVVRVLITDIDGTAVGGGGGGGGGGGDSGDGDLSASMNSLGDFNWSYNSLGDHLISATVSESNASDFSNLHNEVMVTVEVEDTGPGIGAGVTEHVFDRYGRGQTAASSDYGGYGLGLAICRDIVSSMHLGRIGYTSTEGVGSTFWFRFAARPVTIDDMELQAPPPPPSTHTPMVEPRAVVRTPGLNGSPLPVVDELGESTKDASLTIDAAMLAAARTSSRSHDAWHMSTDINVALGEFGEDLVVSALAFLRRNHQTLIGTLVVHLVSRQTETVAWLRAAFADWGIALVASGTLEEACDTIKATREVAEAFASRAAEDENNGSDAASGNRANADTEPAVPFDPNKKDGVSIVIVDAALKSSLTKDPSMAGIRRLLRPETPVALLHSIHDSAFVQSFADYVDGTLCTPLCMEKVIASLVVMVPVLRKTITADNMRGLLSLASIDSLDASITGYTQHLARSIHRRRLDRSGGSGFSFSSSTTTTTSSSNGRSRSSYSGSTPASTLDSSFSLLRVLVVEDDALNCAVVKKLLEISGVVKIETAADGSEGAEMILAGQYDFVLTDMHMPVLDGLGMIRHVVNESPDALARTFVAVLTGSMLDARTLEDMRGAGVMASLQKPVLRPDLVLILEQAAQFNASLPLRLSSVD